MARSCGLILAAVAALAAAGTAPGQGRKGPKDEREAAAAVAQAEKALAATRASFRAGGASETEVDVARIELLELQVVLADFRGAEPVIVKALKDLVAARERIVARLQKLPAQRLKTDADVDVASRALYETRARLAKFEGDLKGMVANLEKVVEVSEREVARAEKLFARKAATKEDMDNARAYRDDARRRLAAVRGDKK